MKAFNHWKYWKTDCCSKINPSIEQTLLLTLCFSHFISSATVGDNGCFSGYPATPMQNWSPKLFFINWTKSEAYEKRHFSFCPNAWDGSIKKEIELISGISSNPKRQRKILIIYSLYQNKYVKSWSTRYIYMKKLSRFD